jgi:DNA polymerase delta subunit 1
VIYGDTDSVMVNFGVSDLESVMKLGKEAAHSVSKAFPAPIHLEFEKCYFPYLLMNKKRYAGLYWSNPQHFDKMDAKGIETVRRDNCKLVQTLIGTCLHKILIDRDLEAAKAYTKQTIADLLQNKIDLSQLVITKALTKSGEEYAAKQAHVELAEKMRKRDAGSAPGLGDRVAYVIVKGTKGCAAYEKAEDPIYVLENNIPLDTTYYLENQLSKPLMRIFEPIIQKPEELLSGEHTRTVHVATPSLGALRKFVVKTESCLGCKAPLSSDKGGKAVCQYCEPEKDLIYYRQLELHNEMETKFARLWTQCQRCQESMLQDVLCTSRDCPIFYMRKKAQKDMKEISDTLERFNYEW